MTIETANPPVEFLTVSHWAALDEDARASLLARPPVSLADAAQVQAIIDDVRRDGDRALTAYTERFDGIRRDRFRVPEDSIARALDTISSGLRAALEAAYANIERFHSAQATAPIVTRQDGVDCQLVTRPIESVGLYVPGGTAPLPSTVLMLGVPSRLAGCPTRILCTPPQENGEVNTVVLAAAALCGITDVFGVGGAQAIAAMAYGTQTIPKADKIFGPGNPWVTRAKQVVAQDPDGSGCDLPAGPSEVLVIADDTASAEFVAADLLAQAEHGIDSQVLLVTTSDPFAQRVRRAVAQQLDRLPRADIARVALQNSRFIVATSRDEAFAISNRYAPEHLIINTLTPHDDLQAVTNAGSVFLGEWTPESLGDYCSGTNHVLPTHGHARHISGVGLTDFQRRISVQHASRRGLQQIGWIAETLATAEGLDAHARAVSLRLAADEQLR
ncbi:MAG: histidinol dehydrogenase [Pseudomonadota bacterium]